MRLTLLLVLASFLTLTGYAQSYAELPVWTEKLETAMPKDWLIGPSETKASVYKSADEKSIIFYNGLLKREFVLAPNVACIDYKNMTNSQQLLRAIKPEAKITINGKNYNIGGLNGQHEKAYFVRSWLSSLTAGENDFRFISFSVSPTRPFIRWEPATWAGNLKHATGQTLSFLYRSLQPALSGLEIRVNYELYDGLPLIVKWISVENKSKISFNIGRVTNEVLALVEEESAVVGSPEQMKKQHGIYVETNYAFNNAMRYDISDQTTHWKTDSTYTSQVNYNYETPCVLEVYPEKVNRVELKPGEVLKSVRTHELLMDSYDRERRGLAIRRMYRTIAPWTTQNPIFMHLVSRDDNEVKTAIDQCADTGYEALILSFGSHCNMEDTTKQNIDRWKALAAYAHSKKILIGSYSLFSSRKISDVDDVIDPKTGKPGGAFFGYAPCFGSQWGLAYRDKIKKFVTATSFDIWENDGPYPGDVCASTQHPGHQGLEDSQWKQMEIQKELYRWLNERGVYINAPDWYFLDGTHKIAIGYREVNFSLSRDQQKILNRQNIFDGTWEKTPSMGWGFVPLTKYQGGGADAILEPLHEHRKDYEQLMIQYYGAGVQACYRGPRLYDTDSTKQLVQRTINWYKKYRDILNSDIIHLRRPDGRDWDGLLHVNPNLKQKGLALFFNPTKEKMVRTIKLPLYYTGLSEDCHVAERGGKPLPYKITRRFELDLTITLEPDSYTWYTIE
ncbi:MAG: alpha-galactosidase [Bacteroidota bacterium]